MCDLQVAHSLYLNCLQLLLSTFRVPVLKDLGDAQLGWGWRVIQSFCTDWSAAGFALQKIYKTTLSHPWLRQSFIRSQSANGTGHVHVHAVHIRLSRMGCAVQSGKLTSLSSTDIIRHLHSPQWKVQDICTQSHLAKHCLSTQWASTYSSEVVLGNSGQSLVVGQKCRGAAQTPWQDESNQYTCYQPCSWQAEPSRCTARSAMHGPMEQQQFSLEGADTPSAHTPVQCQEAAETETWSQPCAWTSGLAPQDEEHVGFHTHEPCHMSESHNTANLWARQRKHCKSSTSSSLASSISAWQPCCLATLHLCPASLCLTMLHPRPVLGLAITSAAGVSDLISKITIDSSDTCTRAGMAWAPWSPKSISSPCHQDGWCTSLVAEPLHANLWQSMPLLLRRAWVPAALASRPQAANLPVSQASSSPNIQIQEADATAPILSSSSHLLCHSKCKQHQQGASWQPTLSNILCLQSQMKCAACCLLPAGRLSKPMPVKVTLSAAGPHCPEAAQQQDRTSNMQSVQPAGVTQLDSYQTYQGHALVRTWG